MVCEFDSNDCLSKTKRENGRERDTTETSSIKQSARNAPTKARVVRLVRVTQMFRGLPQQYCLERWLANVGE